MLPIRTLRKLTTCIALALPVPALAGTVALTPLVPARGVSAERIQDLLTLMSSELEFMEGVDDVVEVAPAPAALNVACFDSTRCLGTIAKDAGADTLLTGAVELRGSDLLLDIVYYDLAKNKVVRRKTSTIPSDASKLIDRINPLLLEAVTGRAPAVQKVDEVAASDFSDDGEDVALEEPEAAPPKPVAPPPAPAPVKTTTARTVDQKIVAPPPPPPPKKEAPPPVEEEEAAVFTFGGDAEDISFGGDEPAPVEEEVVEEEVAPPPRKTTTPRAAPPPSRFAEEEEPEPAPVRKPTRAPVEEEVVDDEEEAYAADPYDPDEVDAEEEDPTDLDAPAPRKTTTPSKASSGAKETGVTGFRRVHIPIRAGYAHYGDFNFLALNAELQVRATKGLFIGVGIEPYFARFCGQPTGKAGEQVASPDVCGAEGLVIKTAPLFPFNVSVLYRFLDKRAQPYVGVDGILANIGKVDSDRDGYLDKLTFAGGGRLRVGVDIFLARNIGINFDAALGFWTGEGWALVAEPRAQPTVGFLPRIGGGLTLAF